MNLHTHTHTKTVIRTSTGTNAKLYMRSDFTTDFNEEKKTKTNI